MGRLEIALAPIFHGTNKYVGNVWRQLDLLEGKGDEEKDGYH